MTVFKFLGREGRTTIPYPIRKRLGFERGDLISFTEQEDGSVVLRREYVCDGCEVDIPEAHENDIVEEELTLQDCLDSLSEKDQYEALIYLTMKWAAKQSGVKR